MRGVALLPWIPLAAFAAAAPHQPVDMTMTWKVSVDAAGAITSLTPAEDRNKGLYQRLEPAVRKWHFTPAKVKGKAAPAETTLTVHITLEPIDSFYNVRVHDASTGARYAQTSAPTLSEAVMTAHLGGAVLLEVAYDAQGRITKAAAISGGDPKPSPDIERDAVLGVKQWTFAPETVAGHAVAGKALVPICFAVGQPSQNACHWNSPGTKTKQLLEAGRPLTLGSIVHLETDVTAHVL